MPCCEQHTTQLHGDDDRKVRVNNRPSNSFSLGNGDARDTRRLELVRVHTPSSLTINKQYCCMIRRLRTDLQVTYRRSPGSSGSRGRHRSKSGRHPEAEKHTEQQMAKHLHCLLYTFGGKPVCGAGVFSVPSVGTAVCVFSRTLPSVEIF